MNLHVHAGTLYSGRDEGSDRTAIRRAERPAVARISTPPSAQARTSGPRAGRPGARPAAATGNLAAACIPSRWARYPDKRNKGVMVPDAGAVECDHFNLPKNE
jgi:hypothetical protein